MKIAYVNCDATPAAVLEEIRMGRNGEFEVSNFNSDYSGAIEGVEWTHPDWNCTAKFSQSRVNTYVGSKHSQVHA